MRRTLRHFGDECLRKPSRKLDPKSEAAFIIQLLADMDRILDTENGLGLAAPQAGENVDLFILNDRELSLEGHRVFVNPIIAPSGEEDKDEEGCLSLPGIYELVRRPHSVQLSALDEHGAEFHLDLDGYTARAVQHEFDHLRGVLFVDRLSPVKRRMLKKRLMEIREEYGRGSRIL
jgi:peptide deformylase